MKRSPAFYRFAGLLAILEGIASIIYSIGYFVTHVSLSPTATPDVFGMNFIGLFLLIGALFSAVAFFALYSYLAEKGGAFTRNALIVSVIGSLGAALHGGYDLAVAFYVFGKGYPPPPTSPYPFDPGGVFTFMATGLGVLVFAWLIVRSETLPKGLGYLGYLFGVLLILTYLGGLLGVSVSNPAFLAPALLTGLIINPVWFIWLGRVLRRQGSV